MSLKDYKKDFLETVLQFLWGKWSQLGVYGVIYGKDDSVIDPEALLLITLDFGRYDPRLFDEVLDWLVVNGKWINVRRLRTASAAYSHFDSRVLAAVVEILRGYSKQNKWKLLLKNLREISKFPQEPLFYTQDGKNLPVVGEPNEVFLGYGLQRGRMELRGMSSEVPMNVSTNLIFKLRSLFGLSSRAEIFGYLLTHDKGYPSQIARDILYSQKSVQDALAEMVSSGLIESRIIGREKNYVILNPSQWCELLGFKKKEKIHWIDWLPLFDSLSKVFHVIREPGFEKKSYHVQSPKLKPLVKALKRNLLRAGYEILPVDEVAYSKNDFIRFFVEDMEMVWEVLMGTKELEKAITEIPESYIDALVESNTPENDTFDVKGDCYPERNGNIEIARDITSFANNMGGQIVIGLSETDETLKKTPIENSMIESQRIRQVSQSSIEPRIKGLDIQRIKSGSGANKGFIIIRVPESIDRPHMVTVKGRQEFWIRDGATKVRMDQRQIQEQFFEREKRNAVKYAEITPEVEDGIEKRIEHTRRVLNEKQNAVKNEVSSNLAFSLCCTPILPLAEKIPTAKGLSNFNRDEALIELLRRPPDDRLGGWVVGRTDNVIVGGDSMVARVEGESRLELDLNGIFEFWVRQKKDDNDKSERLTRSSYGPEDVMLLYPWAICEYPWSFFMLAKRIYQHLGINDDVFVQAQLWNISDIGLGRYAEGMIGYSFDKRKGLYENRYSKDIHLPIGPRWFEMADFRGQNVSKFVTETIYHEFGYDKPGMIDEDGNLRLNVVI